MDKEHVRAVEAWAKIRVFADYYAKQFVDESDHGIGEELRSAEQSGEELEYGTCDLPDITERHSKV